MYSVTWTATDSYTYMSATETWRPFSASGGAHQSYIALSSIDRTVESLVLQHASRSIAAVVNLDAVDPLFACHDPVIRRSGMTGSHQFTEMHDCRKDCHEHLATRRTGLRESDTSR